MDCRLQKRTWIGSRAYGIRHVLQELESELKSRYHHEQVFYWKAKSTLERWVTRTNAGLESSKDCMEYQRQPSRVASRQIIYGIDFRSAVELHNYSKTCRQWLNFHRVRSADLGHLHVHMVAYAGIGRNLFFLKSKGWPPLIPLESCTTRSQRTTGRIGFWQIILLCIQGKYLTRYSLRPNGGEWNYICSRIGKRKWTVKQ